MQIYSATLRGVSPVKVEIELDISEGLPYFQIVGLPDQIVKESRTRVKSAILQAGFKFPYNDRVVLNLSPSQIRKEGSGFELGLALKILVQTEQVLVPPLRVFAFGELSLDGSVKPFEKQAALLYSALDVANTEAVVVAPRGTIWPKAFQKNFKGIRVEVGHLQELFQVNWWEALAVAQTSPSLALSAEGPELPESCPEKGDFLGEVSNAPENLSAFWEERLLVAALGQHSALLIGPPGCGKTTFACCLRELRQLTYSRCCKSVSDAVLDQVFGRGEEELPWANPHHRATPAGLIGGGASNEPGALTRAHGGILFLDEFLEFDPHSLDSLREPLERGVVEISRAGQTFQFPSRVQLVAATNPCRCGHWLHWARPCRCSAKSRKTFLGKLSGPLADRFDLKMILRNSLTAGKQVKFKQIRERYLRLLDRREDVGEPKLSERAKIILRHWSLAGSGSYRQVQKIAAVARTLALIDGVQEAEEAHVTRARELHDPQDDFAALYESQRLVGWPKNATK